MATETENTGPESKEIKDVKEMKEALKDETPPDNKQEEKDAAKKEESEKKEEAADAAAATPSSAPSKAISVHKPNYDKDVVYLYQFSRMPLLPSISPYCLKVETWLRLNGIKYEVSVFQCIIRLLLSSTRTDFEYHDTGRNGKIDGVHRSRGCTLGVVFLPANRGSRPFDFSSL